MNVQGFEELKRVLSSVPEGQLDMIELEQLRMWPCDTETSGFALRA